MWDYKNTNVRARACFRFYFIWTITKFSKKVAKYKWGLLNGRLIKSKIAKETEFINQLREQIEGVQVSEEEGIQCILNFPWTNPRKISYYRARNS